MHSHSWKTYIQACPEAELLSTFKNNSKFLLQLLRWTRNTWRSDLRSVFVERYVWSRHPFVAFTMVDKFFNPLTLLAGPATVIYVMTKDGGLPWWVVFVSYLVWLLLTRLIKYMPHFVRRPQDVLYIPVWLVFNIYFVLLKIYCLFTLHVTDWGTRSGADDKNGENDISEIYVPHWDEDSDYEEESDDATENNENPGVYTKAGSTKTYSLADGLGMDVVSNVTGRYDDSFGTGELGVNFERENNTVVVIPNNNNTADSEDQTLAPTEVSQRRGPSMTQTRYAPTQPSAFSGARGQSSLPLPLHQQQQQDALSSIGGRAHGQTESVNLSELDGYDEDYIHTLKYL